MLVLRLDALTAALTEKVLQYAWPHCGKIGRYVSHRARSLTGSLERVVKGRVGMWVGWAGRERNSRGREKGTNRSPATVVRATGAVQVVVPSLWTVSPSGLRFDRMA
ncbi:hypothetical protein GCM10010365_49590 [Streptomyces poonensis]|uniref:Uncharacterized protein n=1 Tax=Streptomyces poonensis TaxID=68255 RepID=A0A918PX03_9ACTN|nr:hypothetical protein GCM10010365_49590 [Streptomyces poonensis]GLJ89844.1 hypothetical protein GCM10017589_24450 [Streptomyces poonensis]